MANYAQGWPLIRAAIKTRMESVANMGFVYTRTPLQRNYPQSADWKALFVTAGEIVNFWTIIKLTDGGDRIYPSDSSRKYTRHNVVLNGFYGHRDQPVALDEWDALVRGIMVAFRDGDRTLGLTCLTYSLPRVTSNTETQPFMGVNCLAGILEMTIEESF